jgi:hypothetical protein
VSFTDLREFVDHLEKHGRLRRITAPVSRDLEIAEITDRVSKSPPDRNVALLFERVDGFDMPVLVNAFGAQDRIAAALGVSHLDELGERVAKLLDLKLPGTFAERLGKLHTLFDLVKAGPKHVTSAPCQESSRRRTRRLPGCRRSSAGPATAAATSPCRLSSHAIRARVSATSACIGCKYSTIRRSACTGRLTRAAPSTIGSPKSRASRPAACPSRSRSAAIPR